MEELWRHGASGTREVREALNAAHPTPRAYTTVQTVLDRLARKGLLRRERDGRRHVYTPVVSREAYLARRARSGVDALVAEYGDLALAQFAARLEPLDDARRAALRRLAGDA
jgi:predicted transcriptional regulator